MCSLEGVDSFAQASLLNHSMLVTSVLAESIKQLRQIRGQMHQVL